MSKVYVDVSVRFDAQGGMTPVSIFWSDGTEYEIDRILDVRKAASLKAGGFGLRYTVRIQNRERYLFFEQGEKVERWFVEGR